MVVLGGFGKGAFFQTGGERLIHVISCRDLEGFQTKKV